jgi:hypothetical protein
MTFGASHNFDTNTTHDNLIGWYAPSNTIGGLFLRAGDTFRPRDDLFRRQVTITTTLQIDGLFDIRNAAQSTASPPEQSLTYSGAGMVISSTGAISAVTLDASADDPSKTPHTARETFITLSGASATHANNGTITLKASDVGVGTGDNHGSSRLELTGANSVFINNGTVDVKDTARSRIQVTGTSAEYRQAGGTTILGTAAGSGAQLRGGIVNVTGGVFKGTGTVQGISGTNMLTMTVSGTGTLAPGGSVGTLTFGGDTNSLAFTGGTYEWELGALSTANPGVDFDQIVMTSGNLNITGGALKPVFIGAATAPDLSEAFWQSARSWVVVDNTGSGTASGTLAVDNSAWASHGSFSTLVNDNDLLLNWTPIPEPASLGLLALGGLLMRRGRR